MTIARPIRLSNSHTHAHPRTHTHTHTHTHVYTFKHTHTHTNTHTQIEEYHLDTHALLVRRWREGGGAGALGAKGGWQFEFGEDKQKDAAAAGAVGGGMMRASGSTPVCVGKDQPEAWQWHIRNLTYAEDVYSVTVDEEKQQLVLRTSNKKYFKRIDVAPMRRAQLPLEDGAVGHSHSGSTLVIEVRRGETWWEGVLVGVVGRCGGRGRGCDGRVAGIWRWVM